MKITKINKASIEMTHGVTISVYHKRLKYSHIVNTYTHAYDSALITSEITIVNPQLGWDYQNPDSVLYMPDTHEILLMTICDKIYAILPLKPEYKNTTMYLSIDRFDSNITREI